jgi:two-component system chemotaxis response regulator CheB
MRNIIVIGASAGGISAIKKVVAGLEPEIDAAIIVVIHLSKQSNANNIVGILERHTTLPCYVAVDDMPIEPGIIYLAQQDHHLMVKSGTLKINQGPHENKYRPSIDVLFRSAAVYYGHRVIGVILTGMLEDGTSGMWAVKSCGGICVVQNPAEAEYQDMPQSVLNKIKVEHIANLDDIPDIIKNITNNPLPIKVQTPQELVIEASMTEQMMSRIDDLAKIADHSNFVCPDCGGGLWAVRNDPTHRYRCHTGHVYTEKLLNEIQDTKIEESIWVSIRMLEEKSNMLLLMEKRNGEDTMRPKYYRDRSSDIDTHISRLKKLLTVLHKDLHEYDK